MFSLANWHKLFSKSTEIVELLYLSIKILLLNLVEFIRVILRYYSNFKFCKTDLSLLTTYLYNSPYFLSKKFLQNRGEKDIYAYGETPLTTMEKIAKECQIRSSDIVYDLGAGRGRTCFWLNAFVGCKVVGIEYVPEFVKRAQLVKNRLQVDGVDFKLKDMFQTDLSKATVIYLYGTSLSDEEIQLFINKLKKVPPGTKIITISYPLTDYTDTLSFEVMKRFPAHFTWGEGDVYLHIKKTCNKQ